jgi:hypothetical protein
MFPIVRSIPPIPISYKYHHTAGNQPTLLLLLTTSLRLLSPPLPPHIPPNHNIRPRHKWHQQKQHTQQTQCGPQPTRSHLLKHHETHERVLAAEEIQHRSVCHCFLVQLSLSDNFSSRFSSKSHATPAVGIESCVAERFFEVFVFGTVVGEGPGGFGLGFGVCLCGAGF